MPIHKEHLSLRKLIQVKTRVGKEDYKELMSY